MGVAQLFVSDPDVSARVGWLDMLEKRFDTAMIEPSTIVVTPLRRLFPGDDGSKNLKKKRKKERKKERKGMKLEA